MRQYVLLSFIFFQSICFGQRKPDPITDFNTIFICIDSISYKHLYQSKYFKDTLFFCREIQQETNKDSYKGKYLIGESSTMEFFQPKQSNQIGDHLGDWGIEFKTRKINIIDKIIRKSKTLNYAIDTATIQTWVDSVPLPWYRTASFRNSKSELTILEYQADYLRSLGFSASQLQQSLTFGEYNSILSNGKKYPRQFALVTYIKLYADSVLIESLQKFATLNNCKITNNGFSNGSTAIEFVKVQNLPEFPIQEIQISLLNDQKYRVEKISENLSVIIGGKKASFIFKQTD